jgi:Ca2+-binding RTX toxin-like protein
VNISGTNANETLTGTNVSDSISGLQGDDIISGLDGNDYLYGGDGNDVIKGGNGDDYLLGNDGNDLLNGGAGNDKMYGGKGNDTYLVDSSSDVVTEYANEGIDKIISSVSIWGLATNVENLTLQGTAYAGYGNELDNTIVGNGSDNYLYGGAGNDTLDGGDGNDWLNGGAGNDKMLGGKGNDTYYVDSSSDVVTEYANEGIDKIISSVSIYSLATNVENLTLQGTAYAGYGNELDNNIVGNDSSNYLYGDAGNDLLEGKGGNDIISGGDGNDSLIGGTGNDKMYGGKGNDNYDVDSYTDVVTEYANEGTDKITSSVSIYSLVINVENLTLAGTAETGYGNTLDNTIVGNASNNYLSGGAGNDSLFGGDGNDYLNGDAGNDKLNGGNGNDILTGFQFSSYGEKDILAGGGGADKFVLGYSSYNDEWTTEVGYYGDGGNGYATILDFKYSEGDKVQLAGSYSDYTVNKSMNLGGSSALDTGLYYKDDLIAVIQDNTSFIIGLDATFG